MQIKKKIIINNKNGLHARPATEIVNLANKFESDIKLYKQDKNMITADCKSVLSMLLLSAEKGTELILSGKGDDAHMAVKEISDYFEHNFD